MRSFSSWAAGAVFVGCVIVACSSDPPAAGKSYCDVAKAASTRCTTPSACDTTFTTQCASFEKALSPTAGTAAKDCLESGVCGASICLTRAVRLAKPTAAHTDLANKYCATCAPDLGEECVSTFYRSGSDLPGVLVLPYAEAVAKAVANACTSDAGACRANFSSCANDTIASTLNGLVSGDLASCVTSAFQTDEPNVPGGPPISTSGGPQVASCTPENCEGCCREDRCLDGKAEEACGRNANACQTCSPVQQCTEQGQCREPCGPNNCKGCCDGDNCIPGDTTDKCGGEGQACTKCNATNPDLACADQKCVDASCKATCDGCCTAAGCQPGTTASACGTNAAACVACGYGKTCSQSACALDVNSTWEVTIVSADVPERKLNNDHWDPFYGNPDPFVKVYSNLGATSHTGQTGIQVDNFKPVWSETPLKKITAKELMNNLSFEIWDDDYDFDDQIGGCKINVTASAFGGTLQTQVCAQTPSLPSVTLRYRISPHQ